MIDLSDKTMSTLLTSMLLRVTQQVNKRDGSLIKTALSAAAWAIEGLYIELLDVQNQAYGTTASGQYLDLKVAERGLVRHSATSEICILKCNLSTLEIGFQLGDSSGYTWNVTSSVLFGPDENNLYDYYITCQTPGAIPEPTGELRALSFLAGLTTAIFGDVVSPGKNLETDAELRKRYEESLVEIAFAGNVAAYREKMLELEYPIGQTTATIGALQVYAVTNAEGAYEGGHVKIWIVNSDFEVASPNLIAAVQEVICPMYNGVAVGFGNGFAPIGAAVHIASATSTPVLTVDIKVRLGSGATIASVTPKIVENVMAYIQSRMILWGNQVKTPFDTASITIYTALIISSALVPGIETVESVVLKKDGVASSDPVSISWNTTGEIMEWINLDDVVINIML